MSKRSSSLGRKKLSAALVPPKPQSFTQASLARELGVTPQAVSNWCNGLSSPNTKTMARIEAMLGIPMRDWAEVVADKRPATRAAS